MSQPNRHFTLLSTANIQAAIASGRFVRMTAVKDKPVAVRPGVVGETVLTLVESPDGLLAETSNTVTSEGQLVLSHTFDGLLNSYIVLPARFAKAYDPEPNADGLFVPVTAERVVYKVDADIRFVAPWGAELFLLSGGMVVPEDETAQAFYGINPKEFLATHTVTG